VQCLRDDVEESCTSEAELWEDRKERVAGVVFVKRGGLRVIVEGVGV